MPIVASICDQETREPLAYVDTGDCLVAPPGRAVPDGVVRLWELRPRTAYALTGVDAGPDVLCAVGVVGVRFEEDPYQYVAALSDYIIDGGYLAGPPPPGS